MFITTSELNTHLYEEQITEIDGGDETILTGAIDAAIAETKGYLGDYDRTAIFSSVGASRNSLLVIFVKDIATWHFLNLSNPGNSLEFRRSRYNAAIDWLKGVQRGDITPDLPKKVVSTTSPGKISYGFNRKRNHHY